MQLRSPCQTRAGAASFAPFMVILSMWIIEMDSQNQYYFSKIWWKFPRMLADPTLSSKGSSKSESHLKRLDGMENICECRRGCRRDPRLIDVVNVMIATIQQIQEFRRNAPSLANSITDLSIDQRCCLRTINAIRGQIARTEVAQAQTRQQAFEVGHTDAEAITSPTASGTRLPPTLPGAASSPSSSVKSALEFAMSKSMARLFTGV